MSRTKKIAAGIIVLAIVILYIFTAAVDLSRFIGLYNFYNSYPNDVIKRVGVILAAVLVWLAGKDSLSREDNRLMRFIFVIVCVAEYFFLAAKPAYAITAFFVCQYLLTIRHGSGIFKGLSKAAPALKLKLAAVAIVLLGIIAATVISLYPFENYYGVSIIAITYWTMLSISVWTALANYALRLFPRANSGMVAIGMVCFYFCDICVGLDGILNSGLPWLLANSFIWIFYTPAITLLALSCYKYETGYI
jgi:hypothetical protein